MNFEQAIQELNDAMTVTAAMTLRQEARVKEHQEWLAANERALARHREWLDRHEASMDSVDEELDRAELRVSK